MFEKSSLFYIAGVQNFMWILVVAQKFLVALLYSSHMHRVWNVTKMFAFLHPSYIVFLSWYKWVTAVSSSQYGFRERKSTESAVNEIYYDYIHNLDQGLITCVSIFLQSIWYSASWKTLKKLEAVRYEKIASEIT